MGMAHPDEEMRQLDAEERREREAYDASLLEPLRQARCELEGIGPKTRQCISAERVHGAHNAALEPLFAGYRQRRQDGIDRTLRRTP